MPTFEKQLIVHASPERLRDFHDQPSALSKLSPPLLHVQTLRDDRISLTEGELEFNLWFGPFPLRWIALHQPGVNPTSFTDVMLKGPLKHWRHEHIIDDHPEGAVLIDRVDYEHRPGLSGLLTRLIFNRISLQFLFVYRHWRTRTAVNR